jgi:hypothetical protein
MVLIYVFLSEWPSSLSVNLLQQQVTSCKYSKFMLWMCCYKCNVCYFLNWSHKYTNSMCMWNYMRWILYVKVKVKVNVSLSMPWRHVGGVEVAPLTLYLSARWRQVVNIKSLPFCPPIPPPTPQKELWYPFSKRLGRTPDFGEEKNIAKYTPSIKYSKHICNTH